MLTIPYYKRLGLIVLGLLLMIATVRGQSAARIYAKELTHNFGTIAEADGPASHTFIVTNTGDAPLVITRVTASCGCTRPQWTKAPIAPGGKGEVKVTYNPKGRPGPFYKTISIFSNGKKGSYSLAIKGNVTPRPLVPEITYPYAIGPLKMSTKNLLYSTIRQDETRGEKISIKNESQHSLLVHAGKLPHYYLVSITPDTLLPGKTGEITLLLDARAAKHKGRLTHALPLTVRSLGEKEPATGTVHLAANVIDDFSRLSKSQKAKAPAAQLSGTLIEFGQLPAKGGFLSRGGKVTGTFEITNNGRSPLHLYSVGSDDERLDIDGGKRTLKPGATATYQVTIRAKAVKTRLEALINIVCNDPAGPVRLIKVTAYK